VSDVERTSTVAETPLVSVVMATYAGDSLPLLTQAVESVQAQTHKQFEFLIVLDGPIGRDTQVYLDRTTFDDNRVQVLARPTNSGPAVARNLGIERAVGDYIAILDADDLATPERLERQLAFLKEHQADLVGSFYQLVDEKGANVGKREVPTTAEGIRNSFCVFNPIANSTVFARASVLKENPYPQRYHLAQSSADDGMWRSRINRFNPLRWFFVSADKCIEFEDLELWIRLVRKKFLLLNQDEYLVLFRNDARFLERRTGLLFFGRELRCKWRAIRLYPFYAAPLVIAMIFASTVPRLFPARLVRKLYAIRGSMRFGNA
jgi:glycosyltransferase involved in cell wall biosynthesis